MSAENSPEERAQVEERAKHYLTDALMAVVNDINSTATNLEAFVDLQMNALDSLSNQMSLVKTRLELCKEQHAMDRFSGMRSTVVAIPGIPTRLLAGDELQQSTLPPPAYIRVPLSKR